MGKDALTTGVAACTNGRPRHLRTITEGDRPLEDPVTEALTHRVAVVPSPRPVGDTVDGGDTTRGPVVPVVPAPRRPSGSGAGKHRVPVLRHDDRLRHPWPAPRRWVGLPVRRTSAPPLIDGRHASTRPAPLPDRCRSRRRGRSHPSPASHQLGVSRRPARSRQPSGSSRSIRRTPRRCGSRWFPRRTRAHRARGDPAHDPSQRPPRVLVVEDATPGHDPSRARPLIWRFTPRRRPARCGRCSASSRRPQHDIRKPPPSTTAGRSPTAS